MELTQVRWCWEIVNNTSTITVGDMEVCEVSDILDVEQRQLDRRGWSVEQQTRPSYPIGNSDIPQYVKWRLLSKFPLGEIEELPHRMKTYGVNINQLLRSSKLNNLLSNI